MEASSKGFSRKLVNGDYGLAKTCWLYGAWVGFLMNIVFKGFAAHAGVLAILFLVYTPYKILVIMGTWRAANKYEGPKIWAILAKIAVVLSIITLVFSSVVIVVLLSQG
ncbi:MAG: hypothetical protein GY849_22765 [Deltaproteobacteria bacterium]|nr:hypothetical protein [Deltaproteobacteria bacterium]